MTAFELPKIDVQDLAAQFRNLNPNDPGAWPLVPRVAVLVGISSPCWWLAGGSSGRIS